MKHYCEKKKKCYRRLTLNGQQFLLKLIDTICMYTIMNSFYFIWFLDLREQLYQLPLPSLTSYVRHSKMRNKVTMHRNPVAERGYWIMPDDMYPWNFLLGCQGGYLDILELLIAHNADINAQSQVSRNRYRHCLSLYPFVFPSPYIFLSFLLSDFLHLYLSIYIYIYIYICI